MHKLASDQIETHVLRAALLGTTLRGFGKFWRSQGRYPDKEELWKCSQPVPRIARFLSHAWRASGSLKYLTLAMHCGASAAAAAFLAAAALLSVLQCADALPPAVLYQRSVLGVQYVLAYTPYCATLCAPVALLTLMASPALPLPRQRTPVFLDMLCIHQTDQELKASGIRSLAGFLSNSDEMLVLWSEEYFSRLWCVFELAAFRRYRPDGVLRIMPITLYATYLVAFIGAYASVCQAGFVTVLLTNSGSIVAAAATGGPLLVGSFVTLLALRPLLRRKQSLREQLLRFDCGEAGCLSSDDREYILSSVRHWFGSDAEFNRIVRGPLRHTVEMTLFTSHVEYRHCLASVGAMTVALHSDHLAALWRVGVPWIGMVSAGLGYATRILFVYPCFMWSVYESAARFSRPRKHRLGELGLCFGLALPTALLLAAAQLAIFSLSTRSLAWSAVYMPVCMGAAACLFWYMPRRRAAALAESAANEAERESAAARSGVRGGMDANEAAQELEAFAVDGRSATASEVMQEPREHRDGSDDEAEEETFEI